MSQLVSFLFKYREDLFSKGQFSFSTRLSPLLLLTVVVGLGLIVYKVYSGSQAKVSPNVRAVLVTIRCVLIGLIVCCLMRPVIVVPSVIPQSSYVTVLMDNSASMRLPDDDGSTRIDALKRLVSPESKFYSELSGKFKLRMLSFSSWIEQIQSSNELSCSGEKTDLGAALEQASREAAGRTTSGIVLMTDGANNSGSDSQNDLATTLSNLRARGLPVFTVGFGPTRLENDIELVKATAPRRVLAGSPVTAELLIRASGAQRSVTIDLTEDNHLLQSQPVPAQGDTTSVARITFTPSSPGAHRYTFTAAPGPDELITDNNSQQLVIQVEDARPKILYIEGEPRWEYGRLRESVFQDKNLILVSVLRSADGKFYRQGIESPEELANGFPKSEEDLFKYDAIVLGSVEATFFTFDQIKAIEQFVSRRGGTLLALGGSKSFNAGGFANTPLADILPVVLKGEAVAGENQGFKAFPSDRGRDHPAARLADDSEANLKAWDHMPAVTLPDIITETKPGASVILEARPVRAKGIGVPLLAEERYGRGRTLAFMASDTWRWRMMLEFKDKSFETFWRNAFRYMVDGVRRQVEVGADRASYSPGEAVSLRADVADEKFLDVSDALVSAHITSPSGQSVDLPLKRNLESGLEGYIAPFIAKEEGIYRVEVTAQRARNSKQESNLKGAETNFLVAASNLESHDAAQNRELLKRISAETGGRYYTATQAQNLVEDLVHSEGAGSVREAKDLWDMPINFLFVVGLAGAEWFIRKRKGLA